MTRRRILISDDDNLVVERFQRILEPHFEVVGAVGHDVLSRVHVLNADVILLDISMPRLNGVETGRELKGRLPETKFILTAISGDPEVAADAMRHWASGYILKKCAGS